MVSVERSTVRRLVLIAAMAAALGASPVLAQEAPPPLPAPVARPMLLDGGITVAMIALGLFVVCRGSKRI